MGIDTGRPTAVGDLVGGPAEVVESNTPLTTVIDTLGNLGIGIVVVMDGGSVAGVISERDVVWALAQGADPDEIWAGDVMTRDLVTVAAVEHRFRRQQPRCATSTSGTCWCSRARRRASYRSAM